MSDWLTDFLDYSSGGESPPKYMFWVGVVTIAAVLRRKVFIDMGRFQWTPNFYVLLVGPPGGPKKTTAINIGFNLLKQVDGINFGPQMVTWQQLVTLLAESREKFVLEGSGEIMEASCLTIDIGEFGTFFDPENRELVDNLTSLWDATIGTIKKETRTMGSDVIVNPWLNIITGTTPKWIEDNFSTALVGGGFASRPVYVYADRPERNVPYPSRVKLSQDKQDMATNLIERLRGFAALAGEFTMSEAAFAWGAQWYDEFRALQCDRADQEAGFYERQQGHLHKLAMVLCVARGGWPVVEVEDLERANQCLKELEPDVLRVFSSVGRTRMSTAASKIVEVLRTMDPVRQSLLYRKHFFRTMSSEEFAIALASVKAAELIYMTGPLNDPYISLKGPDD